MTIKRTKLAVSLVLALTAQAVTTQPLAASAVSYQNLSSVTEVIAALAGKTLNSDQYTLRLNADYSFEGSYQGRPMNGRWMFVSGSGVCLDMLSTVHCGALKVNTVDATKVRFERSAKFRNRLYWPNPYPNLLAQYDIAQ